VKYGHFFLILLLAGCINAPQPRAPGSHLFLASPPSPQKISDCKSERTAHNVWTALGSVLGASAGAGGTAAGIVKDQGWQIAIGATAAGFGIFAALATALAGIEADAYSQGNCTEVLQTN